MVHPKPMPRIAKWRAKGERVVAEADERIVRVDYRYRRRSIGRDRGALTIVDGWLVFRGERTEWQLRPSDADWRLGAILRVGPVYSMVLHGTFPLVGIDAWAADADPPGEPILPPREPWPEADAPSRGRAALFFLPAISFLFTFSLMPEQWALILPFLVLALVAGASATKRFIYDELPREEEE